MAECGAGRDKPERIPRQGSESNRQALAQWDVVLVMNWLGYGPVTRQARRDANREQGRLITALFRGVAPCIIMGNKAERLTRFMQRYIDIAEHNPQYLFHERSRLHWLYKGLCALRVALVTRELPYYMIPDINLIAASGLDEDQQHTTITEMLNEGPRMILRLPKIRGALIAHPEPFRWNSGRRKEIDLLTLMYNNRDTLCRNEKRMTDESDVTLLAIERRRIKILWEVGLRMIMEGSRVNKLDDVFDRMLM